MKLSGSSPIKTQSFQLAAYTKGSKNAERLALVLPGLLDTKDYPHMRSHVDFLANKDFYAISFDPSGTWESGNDIRQYTLTNYLSAIDELIGNRPTMLVGHSLGGLVAAIAAANNPHVRAFISIMSPVSFVRNENGEARAAGRSVAEWQKDGVRPSDRDLPENPAQKKHFELPYAFVEDSLRYNSLDGLKATAKPKLFIAGKNDDKITPAMVKNCYDAAAKPKEYIEIDSDHDYRQHPELIDQVNHHLLAFLIKYKV